MNEERERGLRAKVEGQWEEREVNRKGGVASS